eukprot:392349-Pyramimonas_sp.AAC.1
MVAERRTMDGAKGVHAFAGRTWWLHAGLMQYFELCRNAHDNGDLNHVKSALQVSHDGINQ